MILEFYMFVPFRKDEECEFLKVVRKKASAQDFLKWIIPRSSLAVEIE